MLSSANIFKIKRTLEAPFKQFQNYLGGWETILLMIGAQPIALEEYRARAIILKNMKDSLFMSIDIDGDQIHRFASKIRYIFCIK